MLALGCIRKRRTKQLARDTAPTILGQVAQLLQLAGAFRVVESVDTHTCDNVSVLVLCDPVTASVMLAGRRELRKRGVNPCGPLVVGSELYQACADYMLNLCVVGLFQYPCNSP